jgi:hypothetical protein
MVRGGREVMEHMKNSLVVAGALVAFTLSARAATLPSPAKLCPMISATADEGNQSAAKWKKSGKEYFCLSNGMSALGDGVVFMNAYQAMGPSKSHANAIYFQLKMYDSQLRSSQIAQLFLPRITAIFAAADAGPVPDALVQAINDPASASVPTSLGLARTRLTLSSGTNSPYNGAVFEIEIDGPPAASK